jgi:glycosyltransferase involved in cell wall biosynthesis
MGQRLHSRVGNRLKRRMMTKLIIQIPCYNEGETLGITLDALPRAVPGIERVEWLIVDDGSTDATAEVARRHGVDHIVRLPVNQGLARAFMAGITQSLAADADIIVNTDADNQYCAADIPKLIQPILEGRASMVIGARAIANIDHFSPQKKFLQRLGSWVVRVASGTQVPDAPSGFRAFAREAAMQLNVFDTHTYTLETIIQAGRRGIPIVSVPIRTNPDLRPSRLIRSLPGYVLRSAVTILRSFATYKPLRFFAGIGILLSAAGLVLALRYVYLILIGEGAGHVQSVVLSALLMGMGVFTGLIGVVADLIAVNRQLMEKLLVQQQSDATAGTRAARTEARHPKAPAA